MLCAAAGTGGKITVKGANPENLLTVLYSLKEAGCKITINRNNIKLIATKKVKSNKSCNRAISGFPTDMQPIFGAILTKAEGKSIIEENIFENRFKYAEELIRMGANIEENGKMLEITGVDTLYGKDVMSKDLRGGACSSNCGANVRRRNTVENIEYILRGYEKLR